MSVLVRKLDGSAMEVPMPTDDGATVLALKRNIEAQAVRARGALPRRLRLSGSAET